MARYQVILAYDGTHFSGIQRQARDRTVQGVVEEALGRLGWVEASILVAGRTDAGVHAAGQVIAFDFDWAHSPEDLQNALNTLLPEDTVVKQVRAVRAEFHPRYDALSRRYRYQLYCQPQRDPLRERFAWRVWPQPELSGLQAAAEVLIGNQDYAAFGRPHQPGGATQRIVSAVEWGQHEDAFTCEIEANAFLYHMARRMVFIMVQVGQERMTVEEVQQALRERPENPFQGLAPPQGLSLLNIRYDENELEETK